MIKCLIVKDCSSLCKPRRHEASRTKSIASQVAHRGFQRSYRVNLEAFESRAKSRSPKLSSHRRNSRIRSMGTLTWLAKLPSQAKPRDLRGLRARLPSEASGSGSRDPRSFRAKLQDAAVAILEASERSFRIMRSRSTRLDSKLPSGF